MPASPESVSTMLPRWLLVLLGAAAATVTVAGMHGISSLLAPAFLALILTIAVHPIRGWLASKNVPGWVSTLAVIVTVYGILLVFAFALAVSVARFATLVPTYQDQATSAADDATAWLSHLGVGTHQINALSGSVDLDRLTTWATDLLNGLLGVLSSLSLIVILLLFLALDSTWFSARLSDASTERAPLVTALTSFAHGTRSYLLVSTVFGLIVAVIDTGALWLMGIPAPLVWGFLAFITNYIPNIGFVIGLLPVAILAFLESGVGLMLAVIAVYSVINFVIQSVIQPKIVGDVVGLSTSLTFLSLIFWAWVLGPLGALLAVPLSLLLKALLVDVDPAAGWLAPLIGGNNAKTTPTDVPG